MDATTLRKISEQKARKKEDSYKWTGDATIPCTIMQSEDNNTMATSEHHLFH